MTWKSGPTNSPVMLRRLRQADVITIRNCEDGKQVVRSSGSVGQNYIEANESLGDKDLLLHMKISRKEAKESRYWLRLLGLDDKPMLESKRPRINPGKPMN